MNQQDQQLHEQSNDKDSNKEQIYKELELMVQNDFISQTPYSLVNITENLLPLNLDSSIKDLVRIIEELK